MNDHLLNCAVHLKSGRWGKLLRPDWCDPASAAGLLYAVMNERAAPQIVGQTTRERRDYLSSLPPHAPQLARAIRGHWGIENSGH